MVMLILGERSTSSSEAAALAGNTREDRPQAGWVGDGGLLKWGSKVDLYGGRKRNSSPGLGAGQECQEDTLSDASHIRELGEPVCDLKACSDDGLGERPHGCLHELEEEGL